MTVCVCPVPGGAGVIFWGAIEELGAAQLTSVREYVAYFIIYDITLSLGESSYGAVNCNLISPSKFHVSAKFRVGGRGFMLPVLVETEILAVSVKLEFLAHNL
ncbi:MAG: hypothetical protein DDT19_01878 [Syntrophomonadaceae bacterium]|nr:hypothetical protein [Bacillota bacterium]